MQILPFNMILQQYKDVQKMNIFAENSNPCFYYQNEMYCFVLFPVCGNECFHSDRSSKGTYLWRESHLCSAGDIQK